VRSTLPIRVLNSEVQPGILRWRPEILMMMDALNQRHLLTVLVRVAASGRRTATR
jgi:hypothetical protein